MANRAAFEAFYGDHLTRIVRACALVLLDRSAAEDVAAEAFARLWSRWASIEDEDHAGGFVFKTAMRLARKGRRRELPGRVPDAGAPDEIDRALDRHDIVAALAGLSLRQRQALVLRDWAGFDTARAAAMLGMRESTLRVHVARGRERLRRVLRVEERSER